MNKNNVFYNASRRISIVLRLAFNDFKSKNAGTILGIIWSLIEPITLVILYWFVYTVALNNNSTLGGYPYYLWLSIGLAPWIFFSNGLVSMTTVFRDYSYLITKNGIKKTYILKARLLSNFLCHLIFLLIVVVVAGTHKYIAKNTVCILLWLAVNLLFVYFLGSILACICAKYKDIQNIIGVVTNILFWLTPVFWEIHKSTKVFNMIMLNPIANIVDGYRQGLLGSGFDTQSFLYVLSIVIILALISKLLQKAELPTIADYL